MVALASVLVPESPATIEMASVVEPVSVTLERGTLSLPFESLTPECLVEIAQDFSAEVTDSTDYYRRQEIIASFARLNGLTQLSATIAAQLMEENRSFRSRWMKVMEAGI